MSKTDANVTVVKDQRSNIFIASRIYCFATFLHPSYVSTVWCGPSEKSRQIQYLNSYTGLFMPCYKHSKEFMSMKRVGLTICSVWRSTWWKIAAQQSFVAKFHKNPGQTQFITFHLRLVGRTYFKRISCFRSLFDLASPASPPSSASPASPPFPRSSSTAARSHKPDDRVNFHTINELKNIYFSNIFSNIYFKYIFKHWWSLIFWWDTLSKKFLSNNQQVLLTSLKMYWASPKNLKCGEPRSCESTLT